MTLASLAAAARLLADDLARADALPCSRQGGGREPCPQAEEYRPLSRAERARGWSRRPPEGFDLDNLCPECRARHLAELAARALAELRRIERDGG